VRAPAAPSATPATAAAVCLLALAACGEREPLHQERTAREWVRVLEDANPEVARDATQQLVEFAKTRPEAVTRALREAIVEPPPKVEGAPLAVVPDREAVKREGLDAGFDAAAAANAVLGPLRERMKAAGIRGPWRAYADGTVTVLLSPRPRAELEEALRRMTTRGTFELRSVVRARDDARSPRGRPYEGTVPFPEFLAAEAKRLLDARSWGTSYAPADPRYRAAPRAGASGEGPETFELLAEPGSAEASVDERVVASSDLGRDTDGKPLLVWHVRPARQEAVKAFAAENAGRAVAAVVDGVARPVVLLRASPSGDRLEIGLWDARAPEGERETRFLAEVLAGGRLPFPLKAKPLDPNLGQDPSPDVPAARASVALGEVAVAMLDGIVADPKAPEVAKARARWALERIREAPAPGR
jgi:hypothetical protein